MTLQSNAINALIGLEIQRLDRRVKARQQQQSRSQYSGRVASYDADQGVALVGILTGTVFAKNITTGSSQTVSVSLPQLSPTGSVDSKPVL
ncbi:MAG: hypothetical protein AAFO06_23440 [Cyanobacteria bacterium J06597_16]